MSPGLTERWYQKERDQSDEARDQGPKGETVHLGADISKHIHASKEGFLALIELLLSRLGLVSTNLGNNSRNTSNTHGSSSHHTIRRWQLCRTVHQMTSSKAVAPPSLMRSSGGGISTGGTFITYHGSTFLGRTLSTV